MMIKNSGACLLLLAALSGCAVAPGMHTTGLQRGSSSVMVQDGENGQTEARIQQIDANLIVKLKQGKKAHLNNKTPFTGVSTRGTGPLVNNQGYVNKAGVMTREEAKYVYRVGPADILSIIVWEHPELTIPAGAMRSAEQAGTVVENDGTIYFPYAGVLNVEGKTLPEIRQMLTYKLDQYIEDVKLDVRMAQYNHKRVYVTGEVNDQGVQAITNVPPTLVEVINGAGGFAPTADTQLLTLTRDEQTYRIDLQALYENGDVSQNVLLHPGDVVNVWDKENTKMYVMGEVNNPGSYYVNKGRKSLAEALSDAGGVDQTSSNPGQIYVFRNNPEGQPEIFHLDASSAEAMILADQFPLQRRDVVYVDSASIVRWNRIIQNITGTMSTLNQASQTDFPLFRGSSQ